MSGPTTQSEQMFENYLRALGLDEFLHEPAIPGSGRHPDYAVKIGGETAYFEVKEFDGESHPPINGWSDPIGPIRAKITSAQRQLKTLKGEMCGIVLANPQHAFVMLSEEILIFGAMLGDPGFTFAINKATGESDPSQDRAAFLDGGKMVRYKSGQRIAPQNTTISAVCVVGRFPVGNRRFQLRVAQYRKSHQEEPDLEWLSKELGACGPAIEESFPYLRVFENPYAVRPLAQVFGSGPWDERFGAVSGRLKRLAVGDALRRLESEEFAVGIVPSDPMGLLEP